MKTLIAVILALCPLGVVAQEKPEVDLGVDFASAYIWRGQELGGVSIQPEVTLSYKGFYVSAWGNVGFDAQDTKEIDLTLGYETGGFSVSVTDYWNAGEVGYFHYGATNTSHTFEAQVGYDFGFLALNWFTNFAGYDGVNNDGKRAYSSYVSLGVPFRLGGLDWTVEFGAVPYTTDFYNEGVNGFAVSDVGIEARKEIPVTKCFTLPLFARISWNPATEGAYFVCGVSF